MLDRNTNTEETTRILHRSSFSWSWKPFLQVDLLELINLNDFSCSKSQKRHVWKHGDNEEQISLEIKSKLSIKNAADRHLWFRRLDWVGSSPTAAQTKVQSGRKYLPVCVCVSILVMFLSLFLFDVMNHFSVCLFLSPQVCAASASINDVSVSHSGQWMETGCRGQRFDSSWTELHQSSLFSVFLFVF